MTTPFESKSMQMILQAKICNITHTHCLFVPDTQTVTHTKYSMNCFQRCLIPQTQHYFSDRQVMANVQQWQRNNLLSCLNNYVHISVGGVQTLPFSEQLWWDTIYTLNFCFSTSDTIWFHYSSKFFKTAF